MLTGLVWTALMLSSGAGIEADVVLENGTLYDGSGAAGKVADLAIRGDRIVGIGRLEVKGHPRRIDVRGLIVAPGFIDLHTHSDFPLQAKATRGNLSYLYQGVTTVVTGNCGFGPTNVSEYFHKLAKHGVGSNVMHLVPHNAVREKVMKNANRPPSPAELEQMRQLVEAGMKAGACGLSTGLIYNPGIYARTEELIALAKVAAAHKGIYVSHIRDEGVEVLSALEEALRIGKEAGLPVHISHLKASGKQVWGKSADIVGLILKARKAGQVVTADQYPYPASSTSLAAIVVPARFREGSPLEYRQRFDDPEQLQLLRSAIEQQLRDKENGAAIRIARYHPKPAWQGKDLASIARAENTTPVEIVLQIERKGGASIVHFSMSEEDVRFIMRQEFVATASDGSSQDPNSKSVPHPRSYGTFPRKIGRYAIAEGLIPLAQALRSASGLPADILRLKDRGYLKVNHHADVVVFDPARYRDLATFDKPHQFATGVEYLFVNGQLAIEQGKATGKLAGKPLRYQP